MHAVSLAMHACSGRHIFAGRACPACCATQDLELFLSPMDDQPFDIEGLQCISSLRSLKLSDACAPFPPHISMTAG